MHSYFYNFSCTIKFAIVYKFHPGGDCLILCVKEYRAHSKFNPLMCSLILILMICNYVHGTTDNKKYETCKLSKNTKCFIKKIRIYFP